ncbi:hypothetical protein [Streptomyces sp. NPDC058486]|uniref:hypothetical protein n=1 Tax=unclassified Streptomyces TaxID=2593676 RepID=UPI00365B7AFA
METDYERQLREMVEQVQACEALRVDTHDRGPLAAYMESVEDAFDIVRAVERTPLPLALTQNFHRHSGFVFAWRALEPCQAIAGEFHLRHFAEAVLLGAAKKPVSATASEEERLIHGLRIFETHPIGGTGTYTAMRLVPDQAPPELWYVDLRQGPTRLHLDYGEYLDTMLRAKGLYDWQYLFSDPDPDNYGLRVSLPYLSEGLDFLIREFPDDDLADLRARLEELMSVLGEDT